MENKNLFFFKEINKEVFSIKTISNDINEMNEKIRSIISNAPPSHEIPYEILRQIRKDGGGILPNQIKSKLAKNKIIQYNNLTVEIREFSIKDPKFIYLHIHGGGWCLGSADAQDQELLEISKSLHCTVISIEYRLAPENPYPAAIDDCEAITLWLINNNEKHYNCNQIVIGGESSGAQITTAVLLRLQKKELLSKIKCVNLIFGTFNSNLVPSEINNKNETLLLSFEMMKKFKNSYYQNNEDKSDEEISTIFGNLSDFPPAIFTVGTKDLLLDHSLAMYSKWLNFKNKAEIIIVPGADHAFIAFPCETTKAVKSEINRFIAKYTSN